MICRIPSRTEVRHGSPRRSAAARAFSVVAASRTAGEAAAESRPSAK